MLQQHRPQTIIQSQAQTAEGTTLLALKDMSCEFKNMLVRQRIDRIKQIHHEHLSALAIRLLKEVHVLENLDAVHYCKFIFNYCLVINLSVILGVKEINHPRYGQGFLEAQCDRDGFTFGQGRYICTDDKYKGLIIEGYFKEDIEKIFGR